MLDKLRDSATSRSGHAARQDGVDTPPEPSNLLIAAASAVGSPEETILLYLDAANELLAREDIKPLDAPACVRSIVLQMLRLEASALVVIPTELKNECHPVLREAMARLGFELHFEERRSAPAEILAM